MDTQRHDRYRGALLGLAAGDALGTTIEFRPPGSFAPQQEITGGGPFRLKPGQWTDDTSLALCMAASLVARGGFDAADQMQRYVRWWRDGYFSSTGVCFDIGNTTATALSRFERTGDPYAGSSDPHSAGNGSIMRLAPVVLAYGADFAAAVTHAAASSRTTHGATTCVDACRYLGALLWGALHGAPKAALLAPYYAPQPDFWQAQPLTPAIAAIAEGSYKQRQPPQIRGSGYVVQSLEAALWAFYHSDDFADGARLAVNLGDDADTTGAVYGQLAGAFYGATGIPDRWRALLTMRAEIEQLADALLMLAGG